MSAKPIKPSQNVTGSVTGNIDDINRGHLADRDSERRTEHGDQTSQAQPQKKSSDKSNKKSGGKKK